MENRKYIPYETLITSDGSHDYLRAIAQPLSESASQHREEVVFDAQSPLEAFQTQLDARKSLRKIVRG